MKIPSEGPDSDWDSVPSCFYSFENHVFFYRLAFNTLTQCILKIHIFLFNTRFDNLYRQRASIWMDAILKLQTNDLCSSFLKFEIEHMSQVRLPKPNFRNRRDDAVFGFSLKQRPHSGGEHFGIFMRVCLHHQRKRAPRSGSKFKQFGFWNQWNNLQRPRHSRQQIVSAGRMPFFSNRFTCKWTGVLIRS